MNQTQPIAQQYKDRYADLITEVILALKKGELTNEHARIVLGVILQIKTNKFVKSYLDELIGEAYIQKPEKTLTYINYNNKVNYV